MSRVAKLARTVGPRASALAAELDPGRRRTRLVIAAAGVVLAIVAAFQPRWGEGPRILAPHGADVIVCLDVSRSMLARDVPPSRIEAARREIRAFAAHALGDRMGLVLFAGQARLAAPLTRDAEAFAELVDLADSSSVPRGGTDIGAALMCALGALEGATGDHEAVLLITDGEDLGGQGARVAAQCRARNIVVHTIGFGTAEGGKIPIPTEGGETFLRDRTGAEVLSSLDPGSLRAIAETTGGEYVDAAAQAAPLVGLYDRRIQPILRTVMETASSRERSNRFQWPLFAAFGLWVLALGSTDRRRG